MQAVKQFIYIKNLTTAICEICMQIYKTLTSPSLESSPTQYFTESTSVTDCGAGPGLDDSGSGPWLRTLTPATGPALGSELRLRLLVSTGIYNFFSKMFTHLKTSPQYWSFCLTFPTDPEPPSILAPASAPLKKRPTQSLRYSHQHIAFIFVTNYVCLTNTKRHAKRNKKYNLIYYTSGQFTSIGSSTQILIYCTIKYIGSFSL